MITQSQQVLKTRKPADSSDVPRIVTRSGHPDQVAQSLACHRGRLPHKGLEAFRLRYRELRCEASKRPKNAPVADLHGYVKLKELVLAGVTQLVEC